MKRTLFLLTFGLAIFCLATAHAEDNKAPEGFKALFNGKDLTGWKVNEGGKMDVWGAEKGLLFVQGSGGGWLMTADANDDVELSLELQIAEKHDSAVALLRAM